MFKKILATLVLLILLVVLAGFIFIKSQKPKYNGSLHLEKISATTEVYFDENGIPHIFAENNLDAMRALGYVHAQDRLFQMELIRRIAPGRLSEIFGADVLEADKFFVSLGIDENSAEIVQNIDTQSPYYQEAMAYLDGVNQYVKDGKTPLEFRVLGLKKTEFTLQDVFNVYGYMSFSFAMADKTDPLVTALAEKLGMDYVTQMGTNIDPKTQLIKTNHGTMAVAMAQKVAALENLLPLPQFIGSNSWVLSPEKTQNGKVIFENDPHIGYSQPATWYQAHIKTSETEIYGFYLALNPFPLLGHNRHLAYGLTMFENDDIDLYVEEVNPNNPDEYLVGETYRKFITKTYQINVKDAEPVEVNVKNTHRGPVINEVLNQVKTKAPVSMYWVYMQRPNRLLEITHIISRAENLAEFQQAPPLLHAPGLNVMYGDEAGNVAWWASGHLYSRKGSPSTKMLLDGTLADNDSITYHPFSENPQALNPTWNYVYSCNNQPDSVVSGRYIPGYYLPQDRGQRVVKLLEAKDKWTQEEVMNMTMDNTSPIYKELNQIVVKNLANTSLNEVEKNAYNIMQNWNGVADENSVGMTLFNQFAYEYYKAALMDEMGEDIFYQILNTHLGKRMLEPLVRGAYPIWIDDITTVNQTETIKDIQTIAFKNTVSKLTKKLGTNPKTWTWGKVHTVEHQHPFGQIPALRKYFNVGPYPISGTNEVLNNQLFDLNDTPEMPVKGGPSTRRVIDFSNVENAQTILPTGNSGNVLSPYYKDQAEKFNKGEFVPMLLNEETIKKSKHKLIIN
jgi:penicillin amidase